MNLTVVYREAPTSVAYSTNKVSVAMYPLCVEYVDEKGQLCKGGVVFLSEDTLHDHQQIEAFEVKAFEIFKKYIPYDITSWKRFSDGCGAQFWSQFVIANLFEMKETLGLQQISYDRFEANEGKSVSDTLGSIAKCAFLRGVIKKDEGIDGLLDIIDLIRSELNVSTKKFTFFEVIPFDPIDRKSSREGLPIPNISKQHGVSVHEDKVVSHMWTCTECTVAVICESCKVKGGVLKSDIKIVPPKTKSADNDDESDEEDDVEKFADEKDDGQTDDDDEDDDDASDSEGEDDEYQPGDVVWGLHGRLWYPGILTSINDVPADIRNKFRSLDNRYIIYWYGEGKYGLVRRVEKLGITQVDAKRAARSKTIQKLYNQAIVDLKISSHQ